MHECNHFNPYFIFIGNRSFNMKLNLLLTLGLVFLCYNISFSQVRCNFEAPETYYVPQTNIQVNRSNEPTIVPVIVHIYRVANFFPVTPGNILEALDLTNQYFMGELPNPEDVQPEFQSLVNYPNVQLKLATKLPDSTCFNGIIYHNLLSLNDLPTDYSTYSISTENYLNIHVSWGDFSYATFPSPGLIAGNPNDFIFFTNYEARLRPLTLVHELGHWLGLGHTFGGTNTSAVVCGDDLIDDTPPTKGSAGGTCNLELSECTPGVIENVHNHMDYSNCSMMFTTGQAAVMQSVIADTTLARHQIVSEENLIRTGVFDIPQCGGSLTTFNDLFPNCDSSRVRLFGTYSNIVADSVSWYCPGATQELWLTDHPQVYYTSEGEKTAYFTVCSQGNCITASHSFEITINNAAPTLPFTDIPFHLDFENNFAFPQTHVTLSTNDITPFQIADFTGYNSEHCLYVPAMYNTQHDSTSVIVGAFNFTGLTNPTVSAKVAISAPSSGSFCIFEIRLLEYCNNYVPSGTYSATLINDMNQGNVEVGFIPSNATQWHHVQTTWTNWSNASNAEIEFRIHYYPLTPGHTPEAFYLDDITIGEFDFVTQINDHEINNFDLFPNPVTDQLSIKITSNKSESFKIFSPLGSLVHEGTIANNNSISLQHLNAGIYLIQINNTIKRFVKM
jgi:hypothetical protein